MKMHKDWSQPMLVSQRGQPVLRDGTLSKWRTLLQGALALIGLLALPALAQPPWSQRVPRISTESLKPGDIVYSDSGDAIQGGYILKLNPDTGEQTVISSGGLLKMPFGVALDPGQQIVASDSGRLIRINPANGLQTLISDHSQGVLGYPYGLAFDRLGGIIVANGENVVSFDPVSGLAKVLSSGQHVLFPLGVAVSEKGDIFAAAYPSQILRIHPKTGAQVVVAEGGILNYPSLMAVRNDDIYVTGVATPDGNFGIGKVVHVNAVTGETRLISESGYLMGPVGIALEQDGQILVADPYTINPESPDLYDGGIMRINPVTGAQTLIARGYRNRVNPRGLTVVPGQREPQNRVREHPRAIPMFQKGQ